STNLIAVLQKKQERAAAEPRVPHELGREMHTASLVLWLLQKSHSGKQNVSAPAGAPTFGSPVFIPVRNRASNLFWRDFPAPWRFRSSGKRARLRALRGGIHASREKADDARSWD